MHIRWGGGEEERKIISHRYKSDPPALKSYTCLKQVQSSKHEILKFLIKNMFHYNNCIYNVKTLQIIMY